MMADVDTLRLSEGAGASPQQPAWIHWRGRGYGVTVPPLVRPDRHLPGRGVGSRALRPAIVGPGGLQVCDILTAFPISGDQKKR